MIRGIFIASLMFCHGALAQQAPSGVPATCNISPNPGENSQNKSLIASQMRTRGLANPTDAQVRCIMNTPREGRLAKLKEMIDGQQGQTKTGQIAGPVVIAPPSPITVTSDVQLTKTTVASILSTKIPNGTDLLVRPFQSGGQAATMMLMSNIQQMTTPTLKCSQSAQCQFVFSGKMALTEPYGPIYDIENPRIIDGNSSAPQYPDIPFGSGGVPLTQTPLEDDHIMVQYGSNNYIAIQFSPIQIQNVMKMNKPTLKCNAGTCSLIGTGVTQTPPQKIKYRIQGAYTIEDANPTPQGAPGTPPNQGGNPSAPQSQEKILFSSTAAVPLTQTPLEANHIMVEYDPNTYIAIKFTPAEIQNVMNMNKPTLKCNAGLCTLKRTGVTQAPPQKTTYEIKDAYTIEDAAPTLQVGPQPEVKKTQYLRELHFTKGTLIPVVKGPSENQVVATPGGLGYQMIIQLDKDLVAKVPEKTLIMLKCTTDSCTLEGLRISAGPPEMPVYKISAGNFEIASAPTQQLVPAPAPLPADITTRVVLSLPKAVKIFIKYHSTIVNGILVNSKINNSILKDPLLKIATPSNITDDFVKKRGDTYLVLSCLDDTCPIKCDYPTSKPDQCGIIGNYYLDFKYTIEDKLPDLTLDSIEVITNKDDFYVYASINNQSQKILLDNKYLTQINPFRLIRENYNFRIRCVDQNGCRLTGDQYPADAYRIKGSFLIDLPDKALEFKKGAMLEVSFLDAKLETNNKPQLYLKYNNSQLKFSEINIANPEFIARNILNLASIKKFNITCESDQCFTLKPNSGNIYSEVYGKFRMSN